MVIGIFVKLYFGKLIKCKFFFNLKMLINWVWFGVLLVFVKFFWWVNVLSVFDLFVLEWFVNVILILVLFFKWWILGVFVKNFVLV